MEEEGKYKVMWKVGSEGLGSLRCPPRSYCCSFCSREFMSAQALGGHMNVHRRDKARLKQVNNWVVASPSSSSSSSSGSGSQGEKVLKKQKLWEGLTVPEKEGDPNPATSKYNLQNLVGFKEVGEATEDLDLELRL